MAQLRSVTCHMGSHSVTCHPTQVNTLRLNPSHAGWYSIYLPQRDGRLSLPSWLDSALAGSRTSDLSITSPTLNQSNHQDNWHQVHNVQSQPGAESETFVWAARGTEGLHEIFAFKKMMECAWCWASVNARWEWVRNWESSNTETMGGKGVALMWLT